MTAHHHHNRHHHHHIILHPTFLLLFVVCVWAAAQQEGRPQVTPPRCSCRGADGENKKKSAKGGEEWDYGVGCVCFGSLDIAVIAVIVLIAALIKAAYVWKQP